MLSEQGLEVAGQVHTASMSVLMMAMSVKLSTVLAEETIARRRRGANLALPDFG